MPRVERKYLFPKTDEEMREMEDALLDDSVTHLEIGVQNLSVPPLALYRFIETSQSLQSLALCGSCLRDSIISDFYRAASQKRKLNELQIRFQVECELGLSEVIALCPLKKLQIEFVKGFSSEGNEAFFRSSEQNKSLEEILLSATGSRPDSRVGLDRTIAAMFQQPGFLASLRSLTLPVLGCRTAVALAYLLQSRGCAVQALDLSFHQFYSEDENLVDLLAWEQLLTGLRRNGSIITLRLGEFILVPQVGDMLKDAFMRLACEPEVLELQCVICQDTVAWESLFRGIIQIKSLWHLGLYHCEKGSPHEYLGFLLEKHQTLSSLGFWSFNDDVKYTDHLPNVLNAVSASESLKELCIQEDTTVEHDFFDLLATFLTNPAISNLKTLEVRIEESEGSYLRTLLEAFEGGNTKLESLTLDYFFTFDDVKCQVLVDCLPKIKHLKQLTVNMDSKKDRSRIADVVESLKQNQSLTMLDLGKVTHEACPAIKSAIEYYTTRNKFLGVITKHANSDDGCSRSFFPKILESLFQHKTEGASLCFHVLSTATVKIQPNKTKNAKSRSCRITTHP